MQRRVGGLVGRTTDLIAMCYSTGQVSGNEMVGGLVGVVDPGLDVVTDCFWDVQTSGLTNSAGGTGKLTDQMKDIQTFLNAGWDFESVWTMPAEDYPRLQWKIWEAPNLGDWVQLSSMKVARNRFAGCVIGDEIFVFGGNSNRGWLYSCEKYNIATDIWSDIADNTIYVIGGEDDVNTKATIFSLRLPESP